MILQHQIHGMPGQQNPAIINAAYIHHIHCKICFDKEAAKTSSNTKFENTISESSNAPAIYLIVVMHVILLNKKARVNVVEREQPTMLSVITDILRNKGE